MSARRSWLVASVLLFAAPASAQPAPTTEPPLGRAVPAVTKHAPPPEPAPSRHMTLDEALSYAHDHQYKLIAARDRLKAAKLDAEVPGAQWQPQVGALAEVFGGTANNSTGLYLNQRTVDVPRVGATIVPGNDPSWKPYGSTFLAVGVRQELYDFGRIAAERAAAELRADIERYRVANQAIDTDFAVAQAYYAVLAAIAIDEASRNAYERAATHADVARAAVQSGMRPPIELTRADADVARYEAGMQRARGGLHSARIVFAAAVGADDAELDAVGAAAPAKPLPVLNDALGRAGRNPLVMEQRARIEAQKAETKRLEASIRPNLFATGAIDGRAGGAGPSSSRSTLQSGAGFAPIVPNYDVGAVLSWPIWEPQFDRLAAASRAREHAAASEAEAAIRTQRAAIQAAWHDADVATTTLAALRRGADAAAANYDQAEHRFQVGLGTSTELADAQAIRTDADIQLAIGLFQAARARAVFERAIAEVR
jgi:outer membrane protein TolC